ncbi:hypothetical protein OG394_29330 [Kribbella sp. NBC_01245]|uniref:hypothetical protein n=1 Tax=Kribbella sp. NBC_01245 TaxID=2903578 RepID=UPI002E2BE416|nr:hypothetical protein [Kribbella sp. NBC_01245]
MTAISSAADLWRDLCKTKKLRLRGYDQDLAETVRAAFELTAREEIAAGLTRVEATAEALVRVMLMSLHSFTEMLTDLLELYARIGSDTGTGDNLRIVYEFQQDQRLDLLLSNFREEVQRTVTRLESVLSVQLTTENPRFPFVDRAGISLVPAELRDWVDQYVDGESWPITIPSPPQTGIADLDQSTDEAMEVFRSVLGRARMLSSGRADLARLRGLSLSSPSGLRAESSSDVQALWMLVSEYWLPECVVGLHRALAVENVEDLAPDLLGALKDWLSALPTRLRQAEVRREVLESILSLPTWGLRHELYAAWVITEIDSALDHRLRFRVDQGRLAFPFHETLIATLPCDSTTLELWAEVRSPLDNPSGKSRTKNIQPDYRFLDSGATDRASGTPLAIEVKQYLKAANKTHGQALADYTAGLPNAVVILAAYGPLGRTVKRYVADENRDRAITVADLRPSRPTESTTFRQAIIDALPPAPPPPEHEPTSMRLTGKVLLVTLQWNTGVHDLDIHALVTGPHGHTHIFYDDPDSEHVELLEDGFDGGPETLRIKLSSDWATINVSVEVYPPCTDDADVLSAAAPILMLTGATETHILEPAREADGDTWNAFSLHADGTIVLHDSVS